jgi:hypothetical protein
MFAKPIDGTVVLLDEVIPVFEHYATKPDLGCVLCDDGVARKLCIQNMVVLFDWQRERLAWVDGASVWVRAHTGRFHLSVRSRIVDEVL